MGVVEQLNASGTPDEHDEDLEAAEQMAGLDQLDIDLPSAPSIVSRVWTAAWPKVAATALFFGAWQLLVMSHWKPDYIVPGPIDVLRTLWHELLHGNLVEASFTTLGRAAKGFAASVVIGTVIGLVVAQSKILRSAVGSMITGLQTMPSTVWVPLAIVLFKLSEGAIFFVLVIGSIPSVANGIITGIDNIPPVLLRAGRVLGAQGVAKYRHVVLPAAMPGFVAGLKQAWAFAWRSLMAGEIIVIVAGHPSLGSLLQNNRDVSDYTSMMAVMVLIFFIGLTLDALVFGRMERTILKRRGLGS